MPAGAYSNDTLALGESGSISGNVTLYTDDTKTTAICTITASGTVSPTINKSVDAGTWTSADKKSSMTLTITTTAAGSYLGAAAGTYNSQNYSISSIPFPAPHGGRRPPVKSHAEPHVGHADPKHRRASDH